MVNFEQQRGLLVGKLFLLLTHVHHNRLKCFIPVNCRFLEEREARVVELEQQVEQMGAQVEDRTSLLESVQSDRTTMSRALSQNKQLKAQLAELQNGFVKLVRGISKTTL